MPTIKISKKSLLEQLGKKLSDEQLADRISFLGTGFDGFDGDELSVEIFPNRPDLLSEQGLSRALKTFIGIKPGFKKYVVKKSGVKVHIDKSVSQVRPYTACAIVKNLKLTDQKIKEIIQVQEKLHVTFCRNRKKAAIGIYPLEHIKVPIYYKALNPEEIKFKPLDLNKDLTANQILAMHPTGREYGHLLLGQKKYPVFLDSKMQIMSMPPIINSNTIGKITLDTKDVFIECSGFDFDYLHTCLNIIVSTLADMGGEINSVELDYSKKKIITPDLSGREIKLDTKYVNKILGTNFKESDIKKYLEKMGYGYKNKKVLVPSYRADILHQIDVVEDIAIGYGYENFTGSITKIPSSGSENELAIFENKLRDLLIGCSLIEVKNYSLTNNDSQNKLMNQKYQLVELENSVTQDYNALRYWLIPSLLETLQTNKHYDYPQNIFEIGKIFRPNVNLDLGIQELDSLGVVLCGPEANFTKAKQIIEILFDALDIQYSYTETTNESYITGRVARLVFNNEKIAQIGEIHPKILQNWGIDMPVATVELNISDLFRLININKPK